MTNKSHWMKSIPNNVDDIMDEYTYNDDVFDEDDDKIRKIKWIITNKLTPNERKMWVTYLEYNLKVNDMARAMGIKSATLRYYINNLTNKIRIIYDNNFT